MKTRRNRINENQKITLTLGQLKRLVKEGSDSSIFNDKFGNDPWELAKSWKDRPEFKTILAFLGMNLIEYLWNKGEPLRDANDAKDYCKTPAWNRVINTLIDELQKKAHLMGLAEKLGY